MNDWLWQIQQFGSIQSGPPAAPVLKPTQVRLKTLAVSLNYRDLLMMQGKYNPRQPLPLVPGSDACAEVVEVGEEVTRWKVGQRCCPIFSQSWLGGGPTRERISATLGGPLPGTLQATLVVDQSGLVEAPAYLSDQEAATLPCAAVTAWNALQGIAPGSRVVVQGTGGVSLFTLQLAQAMGMQVAITSSSDEKLDRARALGAAFTVNYRQQPEWGKAMRQWSGEGADCVVEVGGAGTLEQSLRCLRPGGQISLIGILAGAQNPINILPIFMQQIRVQGILVGNRDDFEALNRLLNVTRIRPQIDRVFPFAEAPAALDYLASAQHFGKVVISG